MNFNNNNNQLNDYRWYLDIPHPQLYDSYSSNQSYHIVPKQKEREQQKQTKKSRGNQKLQRYRRKLHERRLIADTMACTIQKSNHVESNERYLIERIHIIVTIALIDETVFQPKTILSVKHINEKEQQDTT